MAPFTLSFMSGGSNPQNPRRRSYQPGQRREAGGAQNDLVQDVPTTTCSAQAELPSQPPALSNSRPTRHRTTSHYNAFQTSCSVSTDEPPSYVQASRVRPNVTSFTASYNEPLPPYSCSIAAEGRLHLSLESVNPLSHIGEGEWREVYAVLRGTLLSFHALKDGGAGRLLRKYTLQHAEVGLASDAQHVILVPQTRLARLVPSSARRRAWQRDPDLFKPVRLTVLRLRAETDQILLADSSDDRIHSLIYALSAAIDISQPLDERSIPRQCTVPRRRRRQQRAQFHGDLADPALVAEQQRIMSQMYPSLAGHAAGSPYSGAERPPSEEGSTENPNEVPSSPTREEEEIDLSVMREDSNARPRPIDDSRRPTATRTNTSTTIDSVLTDNMMYVTSPGNFNSEGKWQPPHTRTAAQAQRYMRRCMPVLLADANRASDIVIYNGRRMKINWRMELLEEWELQPPSYKEHNFQGSGSMARTNSHRSTSGSTRQNASQSQSSINAVDGDHITQVEQHCETLQLSKTISAATNEKTDTRSSSLGSPESKTHNRETHDMRGVMFCF